MQANHGAHEDAPHQKGKPAHSEQHYTQYNHGNVMIFRDPDMKLIFGQVGDIASQRGGVMVHGFAHKDPAHMSPPFTVDGRMRVAVHIRKLMMNAVRSHPENRSAFESEGGANCEEIFYPLRRLV